MRKKLAMALFLSAISVPSLVSSSHAFIKECQQEICNLPSSGSPSSFFMEDFNELPDISSVVQLPTPGTELWPVEGIITGLFGKWRNSGGGHYHVGLDIAAPKGTPVVSPFNGIVSFAGKKSGYGLTVVIDHEDSISTLYAHNSKINVREGDKIRKGQIISQIGSTGRSTGPHLHYEIRIDGRPVNPLAWNPKLNSRL